MRVCQNRHILFFCFIAVVIVLSPSYAAILVLWQKNRLFKPGICL